MDDDHAQSVANRDEPIPVLRLPLREENSGTSTPTTSVAGDSLREQFGQFKEHFDRDGASSSLGIQDRVLAGILSQVLPRELDNEHGTHPRSKKASHDLAQPGFNLATMGVNFRRFNSRVGVLFVFQNRMIKLFSWRQPTATLAFLAVYSLVCLNPYLLPAVPLFLALYFVMTAAFLVRHPAPANEAPMKFGPALAPPSHVRPAPDMSNDFFRNMRDLQNSMEDLSRLHDAVTQHVAPYINFSNESLSSIIFIAIFVLANVAFLAGHLIPWRAVLLIVGWVGVFAGNPDVQQWLASASASKSGSGSSSSQGEKSSNWIQDLIDSDITLDEPPEARQVEIFELQRFQESTDSWEPWLFSPTPHDPMSPARIAGARAKGTQFFEDVQPPAGWKWNDKSWKLDLPSTEWVQLRMITGVEVETEGEMWVYDIPFEKEAEYLSALTTGMPSKGKTKHVPKSGWEEASGIEQRGEWRRRRWVRRVERKAVKANE